MIGLLEQLDSLTVAIKLQQSADNTEHNEMMEQIEEQAETIIELNKVIDAQGSVLTRQHVALEAGLIAAQKDSDQIKTLTKSNKAYVLLDPVRLKQVNKGNKKTIETLKAKLADVEGKRKIAQSELNKIKRG